MTGLVQVSTKVLPNFPYFRFRPQPASENLRLRILRIHIFPDSNPLILRQTNNVVALLRAATGVFLSTGGALNEKQMTIIVGAVGMGVARCTALVTAGNDVVGDALAETFVEHKILPPEFGIEV